MSQIAVAPVQEAPEVNAGRLFAGSCIALIGAAAMFAVMSDIVNDLKAQFLLSNQDIGWIMSARGGFTIAIFALGPLCDALGMRRLMAFAFLSHTAGILLMICANGAWMLFLGLLIHSIGGGTVEAVCNPLVATIYPAQKTRKLNQFHVWFPGGIVLGGLASFALTKGGVHSWQLRLALVLLPTIIYGVVLWGQTFPPTERVQAGVSFGRMWRETLLRPLFLILLACMMLTASLELGPQTWIPSILQAAHIPGILVLVWITGLMAVLRFFSGPVVHRLTNTGLLLCSSILAGGGLLMLSYSHHIALIAVAATIFALGVCYFWPTMLGTAAERVPKGGALALALLGGTGNLFYNYVTVPGMGAVHDHYLYRDLTAQTGLNGQGVNREAQTVAALQQVDRSYRAWSQSLGGTKHEQVVRADIDAALKDVEKALNQQRSTGVLPESSTATALRSAIKNGPPNNAAASGAQAGALEAKRHAEAILAPAENYGGLVSLRAVAPLSLILIVVFGSMYLQDRRRAARGALPVPPL